MRAKLVKEDIYNHIQKYGMGKVKSQNDYDRLKDVRSSIKRLQNAISNEMIHQNNQNSLSRNYGSADRLSRELRELQDKEKRILRSIEWSKENDNN
jgi:gas vesicle protein